MLSQHAVEPDPKFLEWKTNSVGVTLIEERLPASAHNYVSQELGKTCLIEVRDGEPWHGVHDQHPFHSHRPRPQSMQVNDTGMHPGATLVAKRPTSQLKQQLFSYIGASQARSQRARIAVPLQAVRRQSRQKRRQSITKDTSRGIPEVRSQHAALQRRSLPPSPTPPLRTLPER